MAATVVLCARASPGRSTSPAHRCWQTQITNACAQHNARGLILDLSAVQFMDSSGLRAVLHLQRELASEPGGELVLLDPTTPVRKVLTLTGLDRHLTVADTLARAEAALAEAAEGNRDERHGTKNGDGQITTDPQD